MQPHRAGSLARFRCEHGIRGTVAGHAIFRRGLVEEHGLGGDQLGQLVTLGAANILVRSAQRELRPAVVVKE